MLVLLLKPSSDSLQGKVDTRHGEKQGKLTGIFVPYAAAKGHSSFPSFATFQKSRLLLFPSH